MFARIVSDDVAGTCAALSQCLTARLTCLRRLHGSFPLERVVPGSRSAFSLLSRLAIVIWLHLLRLAQNSTHVFLQLTVKVLE
jgi:hypothetical protein